MKRLIIKSLLTSLFQSEGISPSLEKRGKGDFLIMVLTYELLSNNHL
jgi:hypothetical protein